VTLQLLIALAPLALLLSALVRGRYPGERGLERVRRLCAPARRLLERSPTLHVARAPRSIRREGGQLLAWWLAGRAPPPMTASQVLETGPQRRNQMNMFKHAFVLVAALALIAPVAAAAHVTLQPSEAPAGGFTRLDVRVPNESDSAATDLVEVQFPDGFEFVSYEPVAGWEAKVNSTGEQVSTVRWTATDPSAAIEPGQFRDFGLSVGLPEEYAEGESLTFPSIQRYDDGETVRWIGEPDSDHPAPQVLLTAAEPEHGSDTEHATEEAEPVAGAAEDDDGGGNGLAVAALIVGGLGLVAGGASLMRGGRAA